MTPGEVQSLKVLIVEDDVQLAAATRRLLEKESFEAALSRTEFDLLDALTSEPRLTLSRRQPEASVGRRVVQR